LAHRLDALGRSDDAHDIPTTKQWRGRAFYGPKIDGPADRRHRRPWQLKHGAFDFNLPARFDAEFVGEDGVATNR